MTTACPFRLEQLETKQTVDVELSETLDNDIPRHKVGCTPHECHGSMMDKQGFERVSNSYSTTKSEKIHEAKAFIMQFAKETDILTTEDLQERVADIEQDIMTYGTYKHTQEELEFGCRLAWRNSGRCIMRKVSFSLELQDCRHVNTAQDCFDYLVEHLLYAANGGSIKPVISVFPPKPDGESAPLRIWNRQLLGYAAYKRKDGSIMGDPVNLEFTSFCVDLGWEPPFEKSDFDVLPIVISDRDTGHDSPQLFQLPHEAILEVCIEHPEHDLLSMLNMRWYGIPAISNMGVDIGGIYYQTCPFNGWYAITEIARDLLDRQRYDLAEAVAVACNIPQTKMEVWRDDVQLQIHKAILHSFAKASVSTVDHHTASEAFMDFYSEEIAKRKKCPGKLITMCSLRWYLIRKHIPSKRYWDYPFIFNQTCPCLDVLLPVLPITIPADWVWLVPPAGGSMTSVFHQEMLNFIVKPQYRPNASLFEEQNITLPEPLIVNISGNASKFYIDRDTVVYDQVRIYYGSETGTSLRFATRLASELDETIEGVTPVDDLPDLFNSYISERTLILVLTSTFGKGGAPSNATRFLPQMDHITPGSVHNCDFCVFALGNAAYANSYAAFGYELHEALERAGATPVLDVKVGDELKNQEGSFLEWRQNILGHDAGIIYGHAGQVNNKSHQQLANDNKEQIVNLKYQGFAQVIRTDTKKQLDTIIKEQLNQSWSSYAYKLGRSTDLFSFQVPEEQKELMRELRPGDHVALYPKNLDGTLDLTMGMLQLNDIESIAPLREIIKSNVDLAKPVSLEALEELRDITMSDQASLVLDMMINNESFPSVEALITQLPPGAVPYEWILSCAPVMDPRFYSIASLSQEDRSISICQSVYSFKTGQSGATSRWLRSLRADDVAQAIFSTTDCHLPKDASAPVLLIATGTGIAPFRSFWVSRVHNPMYLFFGCRNREELPFATEIHALAREKRMNPFIAYSRDPSNKMHVDDLLKQKASTVLSLLHNPKTHVYFCGSPVVEQKVRNKLLMILCAGNDEYPGIEMSHAVEKLVIMKQQKRLITEVYGTLEHEFDAMELQWQNATSKVVKALSNLEKLNLPRPRPEVMFEQIKLQNKRSWSAQFQPDHSSKIKSASERSDAKVKRRTLKHLDQSTFKCLEARKQYAKSRQSSTTSKTSIFTDKSLHSVSEEKTTGESINVAVENDSKSSFHNSEKSSAFDPNELPLSKENKQDFKPIRALRTRDSWQLTYNPKSTRKICENTNITASHNSRRQTISDLGLSLDRTGRSLDYSSHSVSSIYLEKVKPLKDTIGEDNEDTTNDIKASAPSVDGGSKCRSLDFSGGSVGSSILEKVEQLKGNKDGHQRESEDENKRKDVNELGKLFKTLKSDEERKTNSQKIAKDNHDEESLGDFCEMMQAVSSTSPESNDVPCSPVKKDSKALPPTSRVREIHSPPTIEIDVPSSTPLDMSDQLSEDDTTQQLSLTIFHPSDMGQFMPESSFSNLDFSYNRPQQRRSFEKRSSFRRMSSKGNIISDEDTVRNSSDKTEIIRSIGPRVSSSRNIVGTSRRGSGTQGDPTSTNVTRSSDLSISLGSRRRRGSITFSNA